jgi:hypothetical protein
MQVLARLEQQTLDACAELKLELLELILEQR